MIKPGWVRAQRDQRLGDWIEAELVPEPNPETTAELEKTVAAKNDKEEPESIDEDPRKVLAGSLLRVKINLDEVKAGTVNSDPPRSSWIQQLLALIRRG